MKTAIGNQREPVSRLFGYDRGKPIDRYYIEKFLDDHRGDIRGQVLEIGDNQYTRMFTNDRITSSTVLHAATNGATGRAIKGDLQTGEGLRGHTFDCIILTQTLNVLFDVAAAIRHLHGALASSGVLLCTVPGISQISRYDMDHWGDFWRFTSLSARRLFEEAFRPEDISVRTYGNVLAASAFLYGLATEEMNQDDLNHCDRDYEMLIAVRATKTV